MSGPFNTVLRLKNCRFGHELPVRLASLAKEISAAVVANKVHFCNRPEKSCKNILMKFFDGKVSGTVPRLKFNSLCRRLNNVCLVRFTDSKMKNYVNAVILSALKDWFRADLIINRRFNRSKAVAKAKQALSASVDRHFAEKSARAMFQGQYGKIRPSFNVARNFALVNKARNLMKSIPSDRMGPIATMAANAVKNGAYSDLNYLTLVRNLLIILQSRDRRKTISVTNYHWCLAKCLGWKSGQETERTVYRRIYLANQLVVCRTCNSSTHVQISKANRTRALASNINPGHRRCSNCLSDENFGPIWLYRANFSEYPLVNFFHRFYVTNATHISLMLKRQRSPGTTFKIFGMCSYSRKCFEMIETVVEPAGDLNPADGIHSVANFGCYYCRTQSSKSDAITCADKISVLRRSEFVANGCTPCLFGLLCPCKRSPFRLQNECRKILAERANSGWFSDYV